MLEDELVAARRRVVPSMWMSSRAEKSTGYVCSAFTSVTSVPRWRRRRRRVVRVCTRPASAIAESSRVHSKILGMSAARSLKASSESSSSWSTWPSDICAESSVLRSGRIATARMSESWAARAPASSATGRKRSIFTAHENSSALPDSDGLSDSSSLRRAVGA